MTSPDLARVESAKPSFPADAFAGTAPYYVQYRVPYPEELLVDLIGRGNISRTGRLLDLACGPGRLALPLSTRFREVLAIDLEAEMIAAGQEQAAARGATNIRWLVGRAEELEAEADSFELITIGEAFHRLDQPVIIKAALQRLKPGSCLAVIGSYGILNGEEAWQSAIADVVYRWTGRTFSNEGLEPPKEIRSGPDHDEQVLREAGFQEVVSHPFLRPHIWRVETIIGNLYSTSFCSKRVLGGKSEAFEADLTAALLAHDTSGVYRENMRFGYTIGRKPCR
jgi:ubiquinone/menaquinone biosynthesis C-methylase UbiE